MSNEQVLCFPADLVNPAEFEKGICFDPRRVDYLYNQILNSGRLQFRDRATVETDPSWKQLIPYVSFTDPLPGNLFRVFTYSRSSKGSEGRLHGKYSVGVGGHCNPVDGVPGEGPAVYENCLFRELVEEVGFDPGYMAKPDALLLDLSNAVGQMHFGVFHEFLAGPNELKATDEALGSGQFRHIHEVQKMAADGLFENWSNLIIRHCL